MDEKKDYTELNEVERGQLVDVLTDNLPVLRAKIGFSQSDLSSVIGI